MQIQIQFSKTISWKIPLISFPWMSMEIWITTTLATTTIIIIAIMSTCRKKITITTMPFHKTLSKSKIGQQKMKKTYNKFPKNTNNWFRSFWPRKKKLFPVTEDILMTWSNWLNKKWCFCTKSTNPEVM